MLIKVVLVMETCKSIVAPITFFFFNSMNTTIPSCVVLHPILSCNCKNCEKYYEIFVPLTFLSWMLSLTCILFCLEENVYNTTITQK